MLPEASARLNRETDTVQVSATTVLPRNRVAIGIGLYSLGVLFQTLMDAAAKWLTSSYPVGQIMFARAAFALPLILVLIVLSGGQRTLTTRRPGMQLFSALAMVATIYFLFGSFRTMPLADAMSLFFAGPLFMTALAALFLRERVRRQSWIAVLLGFGGVVLILRPTAGVIEPAAILALGAALTYAISATTTRSLAQTDSTNAILLYSTSIVAVIGAGTCLFDWVTPSTFDTAILVLMGAAGAVANFFMIRAYSFAQVKSLAPFDYTALIWAVLLGLLLWSEVPILWVWIGAGIIAATGIYAGNHEQAAEDRRDCRIERTECVDDSRRKIRDL